MCGGRSQSTPPVDLLLYSWSAAAAAAIRLVKVGRTSVCLSFAMTRAILLLYSTVIVV